MPARGIHHVDLAVADIEQSLAFYLDLLAPLGWAESVRYPARATGRGATGSLNFIRYPWLVSNEKLKAEIGWEPSGDTREVFIETMYAKGLVATPPSRAAQPTPTT